MGENYIFNNYQLMTRKGMSSLFVGPVSFSIFLLVYSVKEIYPLFHVINVGDIVFD